MKYSLRNLGWLGLLLLLAIGASCGTSNVGTLDPSTQNAGRESAGVKLGGFEVVRYDLAGKFDAALNDTIALRLEQVDGQQALVINVKDSDLTNVVTLDVKYDGAKVHPTRADIDSLIGSEDEVISAAFLNASGVAGLGQVAKGDFRPASLNGHFATVYFGSGPVRGVSANSGGVYKNATNDQGVAQPFLNSAPADDVDNLTVDTSGADPIVKWSAGWQRGDGNMDKVVSVQDLTPIGLNFNKVPTDNWSSLEADYNGDNKVSVQDLTTIGLHYNEGTDQYLIEGGDDGATSGAGTISTLLWADKTATLPTDGTFDDPYTTCDWWGVTISSTIIDQFDTDTDGNIQIFITPQRGTEDGATATVAVGGGTPPINKHNVLITNFKVSFVDNATTNEQILDNGNAQGAVAANGSYAFTLDSLSGSFTSQDGAGDFDGPVIDANDTAFVNGGMTQSDYDTAFTSAQAAAVWTFSNGGAAGLRTAACDWITFGQASPITGDPGSGTVFPDDDPESDAANPEGLAGVAVATATYVDTATLKISVPSDLSLSLSFDVTADENAVTLGDVFGETGVDPLTELTLQVDSNVNMSLTWGTPGVPLDLTQTQLQLCEGDAPDGCWTPQIDFTFNDESVDPLAAGQYNIIDRGNGIFSMDVIVPGVNLNAGKYYMFRFNNSDVWSSLNKGGGAGAGTPLETAPPPPAQDLIPVPDAVANVANGGPNYIQVFYDNPKIRRNDDLIIDPFAGSVSPVDEEAYNDVLKDGDEFSIQYKIPGGIYPQPVAREGGNADTIAVDDTSMQGQVINILQYTQPGRIVLDIAAVRNVNEISEGTVTFGVRFFDKTSLGVGQFTFTKTELGGFSSPLLGIDWGVNAYHRDGQVNKAPIDFTDHSVDGNTVGTPTPDIIFVQFAGGYVYDYNANNNNNVSIYIEDSEQTLGQTNMKLDLRLTGVTTDGDFLAIHPLGQFDFFSQGAGGLLIAGLSYDVYLDYPSNPNAAYYFGVGKRLTVTSELP